MTDEIEEAREDRERSLIMDSGLERDDKVLLIDGRRVWYFSRPEQGSSSLTQRLKPARCANAIAEHMEGLRGPQALTAGVLDAMEEIDGVNCGVGRGPMRASAGVGGAMLGLGSKKRGGKMVAGVGVVSCEVLSTFIAFAGDLTRVNGAGVGMGSSAFAVDSMTDLTMRSGTGTLSSSGVSMGTSFFQHISSIAMP